MNVVPFPASMGLIYSAVNVSSAQQEPIPTIYENYTTVRDRAVGAGSSQGHAGKATLVRWPGYRCWGLVAVDSVQGHPTVLEHLHTQASGLPRRALSRLRLALFVKRFFRAP